MMQRITKHVLLKMSQRRTWLRHFAQVQTGFALSLLSRHFVYAIAHSTQSGLLQRLHLCTASMWPQAPQSTPAKFSSSSPLPLFASFFGAGGSTWRSAAEGIGIGIGIGVIIGGC